MANGNATIIVGSARQEHSAVFSACQVLFHTIYNEPVAGDRVHYALASAFCVCRKDGGLILRITQRKFSLCSQARKFLWIYGVITA